jgi:hypothetical protein
MPPIHTSLPITISRDSAQRYTTLALATRRTHGEISAGGWVLLALSNLSDPAFGSVERAMGYRDLQGFSAAAIGAGC